MDRPKWIKFIVISGITLSVIGCLLSIISPVGELNTSYIVFTIGLAIFIIFILLKLYQLRNWARDLIILFSAVALIPVFNIKMGLLLTIHYLFTIPFNLFYLIYLMRSDVRSHFTDKKRSILKIIGAFVIVGLVIAFSGMLTFVGSIFDFDKGTFTEKGAAFLKPVLEKYKVNQEKAEQLLGISFPEDYKVVIFKEYPEFTLLGFFVGGESKHPMAEMFWGEQYIIIFDLKDKKEISLQEATSFLFENENLKGIRWIKNIELEDNKVLHLDSRDISVINIKYKGSNGVLGSVKIGKHSIIFIAYVFGMDKTKELREDYLEKTISLFE